MGLAHTVAGVRAVIYWGRYYNVWFEFWRANEFPLEYNDEINCYHNMQWPMFDWESS